MPLQYRQNDSAARVKKNHGPSLEQAALRPATAANTFKPQVFEDKYSDRRTALLMAKLQKHHPRADLNAVVNGLTGDKTSLTALEGRKLLRGLYDLYVRAKACAPLERYLRKFYVKWNRDSVGRTVLSNLVREDGTYDEDGLADMYRLAVIISAIAKYVRGIGREFDPFDATWFEGGSGSFGGFKCEALMAMFQTINWQAYADLKVQTVLALQKLQPFENGPKDFSNIHKMCGGSSGRKRQRSP